MLEAPEAVPMVRVVIKDVRTGTLLSVKCAEGQTVPGIEPGDVVVEVIPQVVSEARPMTAAECALLPAAAGFEVISAFHLPKFSDAVPSQYPLEFAPWAD